MKARNPLLVTAVAVICLGSLVAGNAYAGSPSGKLTPRSLRCEYLVNPLGIGAVQPRLSWIVGSGERAQMQTAYRILVASHPRLLNQEEGDLWDTGKVVSNRSIQVVYSGRPLSSRMRCYWKLRVWDKDDAPSAWSRPALWTMGLLKPEDWRAKWIGFDASRKRAALGELPDLAGARWIWSPGENGNKDAPVGVRYFRKEFTLPEGREPASAMCVVTADNSFKMFLNGRRIHNGSNFKEASAFNVKEHLRPDRNVLAVEATNEGTAPNPAGVLAVLRLQFAAGDPTVIVSDASWQVSETAVPDWMNVDFTADGWPAARVLGTYGVNPWGKVNVTAGELFLPPAQLLRKGFIVDRPILRATVCASALGNYELYLNGRRIGDAYFTPGWTDYNVRVYYNTFDVTDHIRKGFNAIGGILADGWYSGHIGWLHARDHYGLNPRFAAQLHLEYADGGTQTVATDGTWRAATGPLLEGDFLMGETYDARREIPGWSTGDFEDGRWQPVDAAETITAKLEAYPGVLVRQFQEIKPASVKEIPGPEAPTASSPQPTAFVYDMGTNFAGFVRLRVRNAQPGQKIVLRFAERLNPDGTFYTTNLRSARATDTYICKGGALETWQPRFTFHGFQYVELNGYPGRPDLDTITGVELTSDTPVVGSFSCSDETANQLYRNICQTQRANFIDIPTDCPQRDERLGWMGDAQIYARTATYNADVAAFFNKWLVDVEDAQLENGGFSDVSPRRVAMNGGTAAWGDAGVICPWTIYQVYGDTRVLAEHYDAMQKWIAYCRGTCKGLLRPAQGYGDWLSIQADTPKDVLATAYFARSTKLVAEVAAVLGQKEDAQKYQQLFEDIRQAFHSAYVAPDGRIKGDTQTVYVLALAFDLLPETGREQVVTRLVNDIRDRNWRLSTGFVGTKDLMGTLTRFGRTDVAYQLFHSDAFPSWGFSIKHGATSIWERWDGWTPEKGFQDPGMNSFAHYSFGAVCEWMFKTIGGIDTDGPAYDRIVIRPQPGGHLTWARTTYESIHGRIATHWRHEPAEGQLQLAVAIPANTIATVFVPTKDAAGVREGKKPAAEAEGVRLLGQQNGTAVFEVGSGVYRFTSALP
ncbi:MAG: glycoside hydrolase family 78 protein [Planctomycetes bacterium]|jgi:alpha-L-rhamnosidase|nr:glycoside hydrolase family 78 protein [Planctomycetota bacterium]